MLRSKCQSYRGADPRVVAWFLTLWMGATAFVRGGATVEQSRTLDAAGAWSSSAGRQTLMAVAQGCPVGTMTGTNRVNLGGFLNAFLWEPTADLDGDGIADENDLDDDGDGLLDLAELAGTAFSPVSVTDPMSPDSDDDGVSDGAEALAGTNPNDPISAFRILTLQAGSGGVVVTWQSRAGFQYDLMAGASVGDLATNASLVGTAAASGGAAPWWTTVSQLTNAPAGRTLFYRVRLGAGN